MKGPSVPRRTRLLFVAVVLTAAIAWFAWPLSVATQVDAAIRRHDWASATAGLDRLDRLQPARSAHVLRRARILRRQDRLADSIAALDEAARLGHDAEEIRRQRILTVAQSGRIGEVEPEVQRLLGAAVDDAFAEEDESESFIVDSDDPAGEADGDEDGDEDEDEGDDDYEDDDIG